MSDFKSKLPDLKEFTGMTSKLFRDIRTSVSEIVEEYKKNHPSDPTTCTNKETKKTCSVSKCTTENKKAEKPTKEDEK